eukprot:14200897-Alexandrium_andersonii.AAC.1
MRGRERHSERLLQQDGRDHLLGKEKPETVQRRWVEPTAEPRRVLLSLALRAPGRHCAHLCKRPESEERSQCSRTASN